MPDESADLSPMLSIVLPLYESDVALVGFEPTSRTEYGF